MRGMSIKCFPLLLVSPSENLKKLPENEEEHGVAWFSSNPTVSEAISLTWSPLALLSMPRIKALKMASNMELSFLCWGGIGLENQNSKLC